MGISSNIKLEIKAKDGISQAIDRQLDIDFNQDIKLNRSEWNTVFDIVKNDQQHIGKQYSGEDNDISNSSHFIVQEGFYELTQNAWNQIKNFVNTKLGIGSGDVNTKGSEAPADENPTLETETETNEQAVTRILKEADVNVDQEILMQVVQKYPTMQAIERAGLTLEERVVNYAKGLIFDKFGFDAAQANETGDYQSDCAKAKNLNELKEAYKQFGAEYVEIYDQNNDAKIDCYEMFYQELIANYVDNGFSKTEAIENAKEKVKEYTQYSAANMPTDVNFESILFGNIISKIGMHEKPGKNPDYAMSADEAATHLMSTAQLQDNKNNITGTEYRFSQYAVLYSDCNLEEIMSDGHTLEEAQAIFDIAQTYKDQLGKAQNFINSENS